MKASGKRILVFSCLLFICSVAHSGLSKEEQFHLLSHYNNASLVEDGLKLVTSSSGLAASTLINYGLWYSICKAPGVVAALAGRFAGTEQNELQEVKSSFCNQLAAVLTSTEIALAGRVSPWPIETPWWQPLRFVGTAYSGYVAYNTQSNPYLVPIITADYFTSEVVGRTIAGGISICGLRNKDKMTTKSLDPTRIEYSILSYFAGMIAGTIVYEKMRAKGASKAKATFAYLLSCALVDKISAISPLSIDNSGSSDLVGTKAGAETLAAIGALDGSWTAAVFGVISVTISSTRNMGLSAVASIALSLYYVGSSNVNIGAPAGVLIGGHALAALEQQRPKMDSNHVLRNVALAMAPALALAVINGFSNNLVYGYSLEESFTETTRTQWQKFYAPLEYLYTLFN